MIGEIRAWLAQDDDGAGEHDVRIAAAALLIEAAHADDTIDRGERAVIERVLGERFGIARAEARQLAAEGEAAADRSVQLFGFTQTIKARFTVEQRIRLIEMLWEVVYADDHLDPLEDTLLRRVGGLLDVPDRERGEARHRALARLGSKTER